MTMPRFMERWLANKAAKFLRSRVTGWVINHPATPTVFDPAAEITGWVYGRFEDRYAWHILFSSEPSDLNAPKENK